MSDSQQKDERFRDRLMALLQWVADRDPVAAARLVSDFADELFEELAGGPEPTPSV